METLVPMAEDWEMGQAILIDAFATIGDACGGSHAQIVGAWAHSHKQSTLLISHIIACHHAGKMLMQYTKCQVGFMLQYWPIQIFLRLLALSKHFLHRQPEMHCLKSFERSLSVNSLFTVAWPVNRRCIDGLHKVFRFCKDRVCNQNIVAWAQSTINLGEEAWEGYNTQDKLVPALFSSHS